MARRTWRTLVELIFPPVCAGCQQVGALLCDACIADIVWVSEPICRICGNLQDVATPSCISCRAERPSLTQIRAATLYTGVIQPTIWQLKYEGAFALAEPLAELMVTAWPRWRTPIDLVMPIALHPERERKRGYNQSTLLARHLSRKIGRNFVPDGIERTRNTRPQTELSGRERLQNVRRAFQAKSDIVAGKRILLVDDVVTSGATMRASADALLAAGAVSVSGYCLARATAKTHTLSA